VKQPSAATASGAPLLVNLAGSPFVNRRPVQRFAMAAWALGVLLAGVNVFLWLQYRHDSTALRDRLADTRTAIDAKSQHLVAMNEELQGLGLAGQNAQVEFLNRRIAERTFPWSLLFERIGATLPDGVRILGVNPVFRERAEDRRRPPQVVVAPEDELVDFTFQGMARSDQDLYRLVDAFFSSPVFEAPRLHQETSTGGEVQFTVDVRYRPRGVEEESHRPAIAAEDDEEELDGGETDAEAAAEGRVVSRVRSTRGLRAAAGDGEAAGDDDGGSGDPADRGAATGRASESEETVDDDPGAESDAESAARTAGRALGEERQRASPRREEESE
jgi:hypothetical protein